MMSRKWIIPAILLVTVATAPVLVAPPLGDIQEAWRATDSHGTTNVLEHVRAIQPYLRGRRDALHDLKKGRLVLKFWGFPPPACPIYYELLRKRLAVRALAVGGCVVLAGSEAEWGGYNDVMMREIERRHGPGALDELWREARLAYEQELAGKGRPVRTALR